MRIGLLLFCSGACALVLQVAWMRELRLIFGASTAANAAVLAIFMAGLGVGNVLLGKRADRSASPLRLYGRLELAIGVTAAATPLLISLVRLAYFALGGQEAMGPWGASAVRLALSSLVLAAPTFLMGGSLPAAARAAAGDDDRHRRSLGLLYGLNTLGAVAGALAATFLLLENLGTRSTLWAASLLNMLVGVIAMSRGRNQKSEVGSQWSEVGSQESETTHDAPLPAAFAYLAAAVAGFTFFLMELAWGRMLAPILGGTTFTFGLILAVALFGIGVGGLAYPVVFRRLRPTWSAFAVLCGVEAVCLAAPLALGDRLALFADALASVFYGGLLAVASGWAIVAAIVVLPTAVVSGIQFPLLIGLLGAGRRDLGKQIGLTYGWNTLGAIAGSLAGGFGLLPILTAPGAWRASAGLFIALGATSLGYAVWRQRLRRPAPMIAAAALFALAAWLATQTGPTAAWRHSGIGAGRADVPQATSALREKWLRESRSKVLWEAEGVETSVAIVATDGLSFIVNGKSDGNATTDAQTQIGLGLVGAVLHPDPRRALVIGLGTGETAGWLASAPSIEQVDVVELEPAVDEMARRCAPINHDVLHHPKVRRTYNDGREALFASTARYDLIVSEPSNPYRAGVAALYTQEFYAAAARRLSERGLFLQWMQAYEIDPEAAATVVATMQTALPYVEIWQTKPADLLLVGSRQPIEWRLDRLRRRVAQPAIRQALLTAWRVDDLEGFVARFVAGPKFAKEFAELAGAERNSDDRTVLEYGFARSLGRSTGCNTAWLLAAAHKAGDDRPVFASADGDAPAIDWDAVDDERAVATALAYNDPSLLEGLSPRRQQLIATRASYLGGDLTAPRKVYSENSAPRRLEEIAMLAHAHAEAGDDAALPLLGRVRELSPAEAEAIAAILLWRQKRPNEAVEKIVAALKWTQRDPWFSGVVVKRLIVDAAIAIVLEDPKKAGILYEGMRRPFLMYRLETARRGAAFIMAKRLDRDSKIEALAAYEPHAPWVGDLLETRAEAYSAANHPLATAALRDWRRFQRWSP